MTELNFLICGHGNVGSAVLNQIGQQQILLKSKGLSLKVCGIIDSRYSLIDPEGIDLSSWQKEFDTKKTTRCSLEKEIEKALTGKNKVCLDCTADEETAFTYDKILKSGVHIVTSNKKAFSGPYEYYKKLRESKTAKIYYEATVGAGLPVLSTLHDLILSGDQINKIEGLLSGTLGWLFSEYKGTVPFSSLVLEAHRKGYTEPDPRDDLMGMDTARKILILARESGIPLESAKPSLNLVPEDLMHVELREFLSRINEIDEKIDELRCNRNQVLRYVAEINKNGSYSCGPVALDKTSRLATEGSDSVVAFFTKRYEFSPLVVRGPGAGGEITAGGIFADILRLASYLGADL